MHEIKQLPDKRPVRSCLPQKWTMNIIRCLELHECLFRDAFLIIQSSMPRWQVQEFWIDLCSLQGRTRTTVFDPLPNPIFLPLRSICNLKVGYYYFKTWKGEKIKYHLQILASIFKKAGGVIVYCFRNWEGRTSLRFIFVFVFHHPIMAIRLQNLVKTLVNGEWLRSVQ